MMLSCRAYTLDVWLQEMENADVNFKDHLGQTLLHISCDRGFLAVEKCVQLGADVNAMSENSETPLSWAIVNGDIKMAKLLIDAGADVNLTIYGINFLHVAARSRNQSILYFLLRYRPELRPLVDKPSNSGFTPLHYACQYNNFICAQYLIAEFGADLNKPDKKGNTPIHVACNECHVDVAVTLLKHAKPEILDQPNKNQETAFEMGMKKKNRKMKQTLAGFKRRLKNPFWIFFDKVTHNYYRFGVTVHYPTIFFLYFFSQIIAEFHLWHFLGPHTAPVTVICLTIFSVSCFFLYLNILNSDPGTIPKVKFNNISEEFDRLLFNGETGKVCVTCGIVRPWRSKHSRELNVCVRRFDHYCPWVGTVVGGNNQIRFLLFVIGQPLAQFIYLYLDYHWIKSDPPNLTWTGYILGVSLGVEAFLLGVYGIFMTVNVCYLISKSMTTNDAMNGFKYDWYEVKGMRNTNLFDMGILTNWFNLISGQYERHKPPNHGFRSV